MDEQTERFNWIGKLARVALVVSLAFVALAMVYTVVVTLPLLQGPRQGMAVFDLLVALAGELALGLACFLGYGLVRAFLAAESHAYHTSVMVSRLERIESLLSDSAATHDSLLEFATLSDKAKSLIYREQEIQAVREAVHHDLMSQHYETAGAMIDKIEHEFGYADEAAQLRLEMQTSREATLDEKIDATIERIHSLLSEQQWARALRETQRVVKLFPDNEKISALPKQISAARTAYKKRLLQQYGEAVRKNDIDRGLDLLKELDRYLTPQEGAALQESARGVFKARLHQIGVQFAISVNDQEWEEAIAAGQEIIREFPNSRMAQEVRSKLDAMRAKARNKA